METVFSADNGFEAYNVLNLLEQAGIEGRVEGELPPAMGMVRVVVAEADVAAASRIIADLTREEPGGSQG